MQVAHVSALTPIAVTAFEQQVGLSPWPWPLHDWLVLCGIALAVVFTGLAVSAQSEGDRKALDADVPEVRRLDEDDVQRQNRLATQRALRRANLERANIARRAGNVYWILAVLAGGVSSLPWLAIPGGVAAAVLLRAYQVRAKKQRASIDQRLRVFEKLRVLLGSQLRGPFMLDSEVYGAIEKAFSEPDDGLAELERKIDTLQRKADVDLREYAERQKRARENPPDGGVESKP